MDQTTSASDITAKAIRAIGADEPKTDWVLRPEEHAKRLPPEAGALKRILLSKAHDETQKQFRADDALANLAQARYKQLGRRELRATLIATLIGACFLVPEKVSVELRAGANVLEFLLLCAAFLTGSYLAVRKPFSKWMESRADAELERIQLFDDVMGAQEAPLSGELPLLPLKLEYCRRYQLEVQSRYYGGRGKEHEVAAGHTDKWRQVRLALTVLSVFLALLASLPILAYLFAYLQATPPAWVGQTVDIVHAFHIERWLLALGVAGSALYSYTTARSLMDLDERNASRYLTTHDNLEFMKEQGSEKARQSAADGNEEQVGVFVDRVQSLISSEHKEWVRLREMLGEHARRRRH